MLMTMMTITMMLTTKPMTGKIMKTFTRMINITTMTFAIVMTMTTTTTKMTVSIRTKITSFLFLALPTQMPFLYAFDDNKFLALWRFDDQADKIQVHLRVKTTGWIGFGFAQKAPNTMKDYPYKACYTPKSPGVEMLGLTRYSEADKITCIV